MSRAASDHRTPFRLSCPGSRVREESGAFPPRSGVTAHSSIDLPHGIAADLASAKPHINLAKPGVGPKHASRPGDHPASCHLVRVYAISKPFFCAFFCDCLPGDAPMRASVQPLAKAMLKRAASRAF